MKVEILELGDTSKSIPLNDVKLGTIGSLHLGDALCGTFVLVTYSGLVDLEAPNRTWSRPLNSDAIIVPLSKGTTLTLTVD